MAANMIGVNKRIIAVENEGSYLVMLNPEILRQFRPLMTPRRAAFPCPAPVRSGDGIPSRCAGRMRQFQDPHQDLHWLDCPDYPA